MEFFKTISEKVCRPNPQYFPNPKEAAVRFIKNKFIFKVHLIMLSLQIISLIGSGMKSGVSLVRLSAGVGMLAIFLAFCRTRPLVSQLINTALINTAVFVINSFTACHRQSVDAYHPDGVYFALTMVYGAPCSVFYLTQNITLTAGTNVLQIAIVWTWFRANLMQTISFSDSEEFASKFTKGFITISIPLQVLYLIVVYNLNKKTDELHQATKKAEEALEQQKVFLYSFSHEMRNPMNSLLGNLDLALMSKQITPELREMLNTANICGVLLLNLINTVLDAGKLGIGKLEVHPVSTRVHDVFQRVWMISHEIISKKGLKSHLKVSKQVPLRLMLDSHRLNQVLMNLLGNATKFTEHGLITLSVSWLEGKQVSDDKCWKPIPYDDENEGVFEKEYNLYAIHGLNKFSPKGGETSLMLSGGLKQFGLEGLFQPENESKGVLKIIIRDTGCGIPKEDLGKLFQKFSQVGQTATKRQMGTGLGLYISKEIIENMGGEIRVYSKPNNGTAFVVCIPTTALPMQSGSEQEASLNGHLIPKLKQRKLKTVVADDSAFNVSLVCNFYQRIGVEVIGTASNGKMAFERYLDIIKEGSLDIVTLDIDMPIMNGKEVCEKIREYEKEKKLKPVMIILISGNYEEKDIFEMLLNRENGAKVDCFLKKPLVFEDLCWALYKHEQRNLST